MTSPHRLLNLAPPVRTSALAWLVKWPIGAVATTALVSAMFGEHSTPGWYWSALIVAALCAAGAAVATLAGHVSDLVEQLQQQQARTAPGRAPVELPRPRSHRV